MTEEALAALRAPSRAVSPAPPPARRQGELILALLVAVQIALVCFLLWLFADPAFQARSDLEARPLVAAGFMPAPGPLADTINVFSGPADLDDAVERLGYRRQLVPDPGHFAWIVLTDATSPRDPLRRLYRFKTGRGAWRRAVSDGVLNFFYDMGSRSDYFIQNWSAVGAPELKESALLGWTKGIDFCALSTYLPDHCQGLRFLQQRNPRLPVLAPAPLPAEQDLARRDLAGLRRVMPLAPGFHRLSPRLAAYVYVTRPLPDFRYGLHDGVVRRHAAMALLLRGRHGVTLASGVDGLPPDELIRRVEAAGGGRVDEYVGATGLRFGMTDPEAAARLRRLRRSHPDLVMVPSYATSPAAYGLIRSVFGAGHFQAGTLGARITF